MFLARPALTMALLSGFVMMAISTPPALADFNGKFPGKGSYAAWDAAANLDKQAYAAESRGDFKAAEALYRRVLQTYSYDAADYFNLGLFLNRQKRYKEAEPYLRKSIELQPVFQNWHQLGIALEETDKIEDADRSFIEASKYAKTPLQRKDLKDDQAALHDYMRKHK